MRKNVGKRIMEIADIMKGVILAFAIVIGGFNILMGIITLVTTEDFSSDVGNPIFSLVIQPILVGVIWIAVGKFVAECATILTYGFGILVDKAEYLSPNYLSQDAAQTVPANNPGWVCKCGHTNPQTTVECEYCSQPKQFSTRKKPKPSSAAKQTSQPKSHSIYCRPEDCADCPYNGTGCESQFTADNTIECPSCGKKHDFDYPKCPYCGYRHKQSQ